MFQSAKLWSFSLPSMQLSFFSLSALTSPPYRSLIKEGRWAEGRALLLLPDWLNEVIPASLLVRLLKKEKVQTLLEMIQTECSLDFYIERCHDKEKQSPIMINKVVWILNQILLVSWQTMSVLSVLVRMRAKVKALLSGGLLHNHKLHFQLP